MQWVRCPRQVFDNANAFAARRFAGLRRFVGNKVGDVDRLVDKNFAPRLNLGEIENVANQIQKIMSGLVDEPPYSKYLADESPNDLFRTMLEKPMMAFKGVLSS